MLTATATAPPLTPRFASVADITAPWHLLVVKSREERSFAGRMLERDVPYFLPMEPVRQRIAGKIRETMRVFFPGYIFVAWEQDDWETCHAVECPGFLKVHHIANQNQFRRELLGVELSCGRAVNGWTPGTPLRLGDSVHVKGGPFKGQIGRVTMIDQKACVVMGLTVFGGIGVPVEIDPADLERV